jgi:hypothetical protein
MTTSTAGSWAIAAGGFTGLIGMWLVLAYGVRSQQNDLRRQRSDRERAAAGEPHDADGEQAAPLPGQATAAIGRQRRGPGTRSKTNQA